MLVNREDHVSGRLYFLFSIEEFDIHDSRLTYNCSTRLACKAAVGALFSNSLIDAAF